jgi:DNA (cytosine-5)-methyltransferase 1
MKIVCEERTDEGLRFFKDGCIGTLRTIDGGGDKRVIEIKEIGNIYADNGYNSQAGRVYDENGISPTLDTCSGGNKMPKFIVASRGRNKDNPSDRTLGNHVEQRLEQNSEGICNTPTSVQKDNLVLEPAILTPKRTEYGKTIRKAYESGVVQENRHNMTELQPRDDGISNTLTTVQKDNLLLEPTYRIRKLTPLECWLLMDFTETDFRKAEKVNSNTQLYKQAGNSIVRAVLMGIFKQMIQNHS